VDFGLIRPFAKGKGIWTNSHSGPGLAIWVVCLFDKCRYETAWCV